MKKITVLIADDHEIVRSGLAAVLGYRKNFKVVGQVSNGEQAVKTAAELKPDLVVMDLLMPVMDGVEATRRISSFDPQPRVLILTTYASSADVVRAVEAGATGAVSKDTPNDQLIGFMEKVAEGEQAFSPDIEGLFAAESRKRKLTGRQLEVLRGVARGLTNPELARQLEISVSGVNFHLKSVFAALGVANRTEAAAIAVQEHLV